MRKYAGFLLFACLLMCLMIPVHAADAETVPMYLEPKFLTADGEYYPLYDTELADFLRRASSAAYDVGDNSGDHDLDLYPAFGNLQMFSVDDYSIQVTKTNTDGEEVTAQLHLTCHFLTAAKQFTVNGQEKNVVLVSFRGTAGLTDGIIDALITDNDGFHLGFLGCADLAYEALLNNTYAALGGESFASVLEKAKDPTSGYYILVTGHSLGGAVANIFTCRYLNSVTKNPLNTLCYTFAAPKVCAPEAAEQYDSSNIVNIVNSSDLVPNVGYLLTTGVTPGRHIEALATEYQDLLDIFLQHSINYVYASVLEKVEAMPESFYPYLTRNHAEPDEIVISRWSNYFDENGMFVDNSIPATIADRFSMYHLVIDGGSLGVYGGARLPDITVRNSGSLTCDSNRANCVSGSAVIESGSLSTGSGFLQIAGDLRLQARQADGSYTGSSGHLVMQDDAGHLLVSGSVWFQGGDSNFLYQRDMTAGTLEVKGDFTVLPSTGGQNEMVFCPGGTHQVLLSGTTPQTIFFSPGVDDSSYISAYFNMLKSTNPCPLIAPHPISFEYLTDDLTFRDDLALNGMGNMVVNSDVVLCAENIILSDSASPEVYAHLTLDGNLSGGRLDIGKYAGDAGTVTITGDLSGTDLYYASSATPSVVEVRGSYLNNNADLCLCSGHLLVSGDFRHQVKDGDDLYTEANAPFASIYEGSRIEVGGDFFLQMESEGKFNLPEECPLLLKGDFIQICDQTDPDFWNYGLHSLVLAGTSEQRVDAPAFYFTDITLANTSDKGVTFLHGLYGLSGIFNAYGRADGMVTPYSFPRDCAPDWKDSDYDSIPDCLDPEPLAEKEYDRLPAAISGGVRDENAVRFLYAAISGQMPENTVVWIALYADGQLVELREAALNMEIHQLHELEIELSSESAVDTIQIFQLHTDTFSPLWPVSVWRGN